MMEKKYLFGCPVYILLNWHVLTVFSSSLQIFNFFFFCRFLDVAASFWSELDSDFLNVEKKEKPTEKELEIGPI